MFLLNLPDPSNRLLEAINEDITTFLKDYEPRTLPAGTLDFIYILGDSRDIGIEEYSKFFEEPIDFTILLFRPDKNTESSVFPAHSDLGRTTGINYILNAGGSNATTSWYNKVAETVGMAEWPTETLQNLKLLGSYVYDEKQWLVMESLRFHSVENVTCDRIIITISFNGLSYTDFLLKYRHLITGGA